MESRLEAVIDENEISVKESKKQEGVLYIDIAVSPLSLFGKEDKITLSEKLISACLKKDERSALYFIENGADVNWVSRKHNVVVPKPPFLTQWVAGSMHCFQTATPLLAAVVNELDQVVRELIKRGADPNIVYKFIGGRLGQGSIRDRRGPGPTADETPLHVAVRIPNNVRVIRALLDGGANARALADYNDEGAIIATSISPEHSAYLLKEVALSCALGCIVFSLCCSRLFGVTKTPNVTPLQMATLSGFQENVDALNLRDAPLRMAMGMSSPSGEPA